MPAKNPNYNNERIKERGARQKQIRDICLPAFDSGEKMRTRKDMDYIYTDGDIEILIEGTQKKTRAELTSQYVRCRKDKHLTQADLAKRAGMPRPNIARFESGTYNPSLEMMVRIAAALGMRLEISLKEMKED